MASIGRIETFHRTLVDHLHVVMGQRFSIRHGNWKHVVKGSTISFDMVRDDYTTTAERTQGGRCPVFPLRPAPTFEDQVWVAWHEEWHCEQRGEFDLIGGGWTFFWGTEGRLGCEQEILRAEWDQVRDREDQRHRRGGIAAQPHWHLETGMMAGYTRPIPCEALPEEATDLEEIACVSGSELEEFGKASGIQELDLSAMHLGMGGWENDDQHPRCWQKQVAGELTELVLWAVRTLELACDQFKELDINEIVV